MQNPKLSHKEYYAIVIGTIMILEGGIMLSDFAPPTDSVSWAIISIGSLLFVGGVLVEVKSFEKIKTRFSELEQRIKKLEDKINDQNKPQ